MITQEQLNAINRTLILSILYGGDSGGAYFSLNCYEDEIDKLAEKLDCDVVWYDMCSTNEEYIKLSNIYTKYDWDYGNYRRWPYLTLKGAPVQENDRVRIYW